MADDGRYWTDSISPVTGCTPAGAGCDHCWARAMVGRFGHLHAVAGDDGECVPQPFDEPRFSARPLAGLQRWKKPRRVALSWLGDLFHHDVQNHQIARVLTAMSQAPQNRYLVLTKRAGRMVEYLNDSCSEPSSNEWWGASAWDNASASEALEHSGELDQGRNFWLSLEPLLGPVTLIGGMIPDWVVVGQETGPGARPCRPEWVEQIVDDCRTLRVPVWVKSAPVRADGRFWPREMPKGLWLPGEVRK